MSETFTEEGEKPIETTPLGTSALARMDPTDQSEAGLKLFEERVRTAKKQIALALKLVSPGQFVVMTQTKKDGEVVEQIYATGGAADRILRFGFGMRWGDKEITLTNDPDGTEVAIARAPLYTHAGQVYEFFEGRRRMGGFAKNQGDLIKDAIENMKHQAVTDILGLRFLTPKDLAELGLDVSSLPRRADFQDRAGDDVGPVKVPWGQKKGTPITELDAKDLGYYTEKAREAVNDPTKAKFRAKEQRWLDALELEHKRRADEASKPKEPAGKPILLSGDAAARAQKVSDMLDAAGLKGKERTELVKRATGKGSPADLNDDDVGRVQAAIADLAAEPGAKG